MSERRNRDKSKVQELTEESPRYFLNPESVSCHLYCSICQEVFSDPQRAPCGHSFCKKSAPSGVLLKHKEQDPSILMLDCILPWLKHSRTCPEDRKHLRADQLHHDFILENIIGDQMVACPHRLIGCEYVGQLQQLASHKKTCDFNPQNLPEFVLKSSPLCEASTNVVNLEPEGEAIGSPGKPSLMLRLFRSGDSQKQMLKSMFDGSENKH